MSFKTIGMSILVLFAGALPSAAAARLAITVVDGSDQPLPCRVLVRPAGGECVVPGGAVDLVIGPDRWFYCDGRVDLDVPAGRVELRVEHGLEYKRIKQTLVIPEAGLEKTLHLDRWIEMHKLGYRCGENHLHVDCPRVGLMLVCEGLDFGSSLTWWNGPDRQRPIPPGSGHVRYLSFAGRRVPVSVYDAELEHAWGACYLTGATEPLALPSEAGRPNVDSIREAVAAGAIAHYQAGWSREVLLDALLGLVHTVNVCNNNFHLHRFQPRSHYSNLLEVDGFPTYPDTPTGMMRMNTETYYRLLNCGLRLAAGAGSATGVKQVPAGYNRAYVRCKTDGLKAFYESWAAGRNFVTNGPMVLLRAAGGESPGDQIALPPDGGRLRLSIEVLSDCPLTGVQLVANGHIVKSFEISDAHTVRADWETEVRHGTWIALRATGRDELLSDEELARYAAGADDHPYRVRPCRLRFGHTSPIYVSVGGRGPRVDKSVTEARRMLDQFEQFAARTASEAHRLAIRQAVDEARRRLDRRAARSRRRSARGQRPDSRSKRRRIPPVQTVAQTGDGDHDEQCEDYSARARCDLAATLFH